MAWITPDADGILRKISFPELVALRTKVLAVGQADPLAEEITDAVRDVRARAAVKNRVHSDRTRIPDELHVHALSIITWRLIGRLPAKSLATEERKLAYQDALAALDRLADGKLVIEAPDEPSTEERGGQTAAKLVKSTPLNRDRKSLNGLI